MADSFWGDAAEDMHKTAQAKAESFKHHPSGVHFQNAVKHYRKALDAHHSGADDAEVVKHWGRGDKHMAKGEKMTLESVDQIDEGRKASPLKGHPYHEKSDAELHYILKDAGEAARAGRGLSSEGKYLDQMNDAATVLYHRRMGGKQVVKKPVVEDTEVDEALVSKATLARYKAKSKAKFREKGGISAALDKQDKEDQEHWGKMAALRKQGPEAVQAWRKSQGLNREEVEVLDELSPKTLKSYVKKAGGTGRNSGWGLNVKGEKEEDKSMSTDGNKYPEKQARHQKAASKLYHKSFNRDQGTELAKNKLRESIVDTVMVQDEPNASSYISEIEARCNDIVAEIKDEMKKALFNFREGHSLGQLRQAADAHRYHRANSENEAKFHRTGKKKYGADISKAAGKDKKADQHNKARLAADDLARRMQSAGVSHSSKLPKGK